MDTKEMFAPEEVDPAVLHAQQEEYRANLNGLVHQVVHAHGHEVEFGDLLIFLERNKVPHEVAHRSIWDNILERRIGFSSDSAHLVSIDTPGQMLENEES